MPRQILKKLNPFAEAWQHRLLISAMVRREVSAKYRSSWLGQFWSLLTPLAMLGVYGFVFGVVFQARWGTSESDTVLFASSLFCGLAVFGLMAEMLTRSPELIVRNANYVKKVVFPLEILTWVEMGSALIHFAIAMFVLGAVLLLTGKGLSWSILLLPVLILPLVLMLIGISLALASVGVFFRDLNLVMPPLTTAILFLSPALYPLEMVPEAFRPWLQLNPITPTIEFVRQAMLLGELPSIGRYSAQFAAGALILVLGHILFLRLRKGFSDCL